MKSQIGQTIHTMTTLEQSPTNVLQTLSKSLQSASSLLQSDSIIRSQDGISLLDVKSELLISYLQNLVFLLIVKLQKDAEIPDAFVAEVTRQLVSDRVCLEKGVRPLEGRIRYQIEKVVRAADVADKGNVQGPTMENRMADEPLAAERRRDDAGVGNDPKNVTAFESVDELSYRPDISAFSQKRQPKTVGDLQRTGDDGIYRPPKARRALPTTNTFDDKPRSSRKPQRSHAIDEYIGSEMSGAPLAEPSIGSTIIAGGRHTKSEKERRQEAERISYEESNFSRLPPQSKKDRASKGGRQQGGFGGEELRGLGEGLDRISRLTSKRGGDRGDRERHFSKRRRT